MIRQFKDSIWQPEIGIRFGIFIRFDSGGEIRLLNHCWLLLISPFQCLVVSPVELNGFLLKVLATKFLIIPATSASVETLFSVSGV